MDANDIKKGTRVRLSNGWFGTMADNKKGNIRTVEVEGVVKELGSVYTRDLEAVLNPASGEWEAVLLSKAQAKAAARITQAGF